MALEKVTTTYGVVVGAPRGDSTVFRGIPYAKPPVGARRFAPPEAPDAWEGERICKEFAPACIQGRRPGEPVCDISEDCLYLNVYTPAVSADEKLPVLFWIYGGGFSGGSSSNPEFDGEAINRRGAILVTINYRCNVLGFFAHPELEKKYGHNSSLGILDQIAALKWVRENIAFFGGDPERVLVFGQSAGGISVRMLLCSPLAKGLFSRAVVESGGGLNEADPILPQEEFSAFCQRCMERLGWSFEDIMARDAEEVSRSMDQAAREVIGGFAVGYFQPFLDGCAITDVPGKLIKRGEYMDIPIICGTVAGDSWMFTRLVREQLRDNTPFFRGFSYAPGEAWARWQTRAGRTPIYTYYMDRKQPGGGPSHTGHRPAARHDGPPYGAGTFHGSEIAYVFGRLGWKGEHIGAPFSELDHQMSKAMTDYWVNFAKNGDPNGEGLPLWPKHTDETPFAMHFGDDGWRAENIVLTHDEERTLEHTIRNPGMLDTVEGL